MAVVALAATLDVSGVLAAPGAPAPGPQRIQLEAHDQPVRDVLLKLGGLAHINVTVADDVRGNVNLSLHDATADEAVHAVCSQLQLRCVREGRSLAVYAQSSVVVPLAIVRAPRAAQLVHQLFPRLAVRVDTAANALVLAGSANDIQSARTVITGLDVRDATKPTTEAVTLRTQSAQTVADRLRSLYPAAKISVLSKTTLLISATPPDLAQIKTLVAGIDAPTPPPVSVPVSSDAVKVSQRRPQDVARAVTAQIPKVRAAVSGTSITLTGAPDDVTRAKALIAQLDLPPFGARYTQIYRVHNVDAKSVGALIQRSFPAVTVTVDADLNSLSVTATAAEQQRISDGIAQIDGTATAANGQNPPGGGGGAPSSHEVIQLKSIVPGVQAGAGGTSTTPQDIGAAVQQAIQGQYPDLRVTVPNGTQQLILTGSPQAIRAARELIAELDVVPQSVVLDTEILELDENSSKNLGLQIGNSVSSTFTEQLPPVDANNNPTRLIGIQPFGRSQLVFTATLNLLISSGKARVLADPRITTLSGRTASIRAGDTLSILTTTGGGNGVVATQQLQSFQTGVTLDITPIITNNGELTVALHPIVNSLTGFFNQVPEISTRDTQTTVHLRDNETLVIGGLIQENSQRNETKIPFLGSLPLIGRAFRNENVTSTRNELIIVVTPHIINGSATSTVPSAAIPPGMVVPTPRALPTVPPNLAFPSAAPQQQPPQQQQQQQRRATPAPPVGTPVPLSVPGASASPTPQATPTALAQANVYVFGSPPPSTFAAPGDAPQIFYAMFSPTVLTPNANVRISAITTTNVQRVTIGVGNTNISLSSLGTGIWQGLFSANVLNLPPTATSVQLTLIAARNDGQTASIPIPVSFTR